MKIIGYRRSDFVTKEGRPVTGCRIYLATEIASQNGEGVFVRDMYLSDAKMTARGHHRCVLIRLTPFSV